MNEIMRQIEMIESGGVAIDNGGGGGYEDLASMQVALSLQEREQREAQRAAAMMGFLGAMHHNPGDDELRRAIEESKHANPNPDNMTYEQLLEFEERNGKVSKGLTDD